MVFHFLAHFGDEKKGSEKSAPQCPFDRRGGGQGEGGLKLFGQCPYGNNTFQKGASRTVQT